MIGRVMGLPGLWLLALLVLAAPWAHAQEIAVSPLAPPDTSSPRATLESFRANTELAFRGLYDGRDKMQPLEWQALTRAVACLDRARGGIGSVSCPEGQVSFAFCATSSSRDS